MTATTIKSDAPVPAAGNIASLPRRNRQNAAAIDVLKQRDNHTNWRYLAGIYVIIAAAIAGAIAVDAAAAAGQIAWWWSIPATVLAIVVVGASQHQFGGAIHEGTHYMLFADRRLNELASDWLAAFPIYTSTYHFRLHHLAHHQFVNDPERDPDLAQLEDSGHGLDFPITHVEMLWALLKQLWLPNLVRYTLTRARYSSVGTAHNPYRDPDRLGSEWPVRAGILYAVAVPAASIAAGLLGDWRHVALILIAAWSAAIAYYALIPDDWYPRTRLEPVISHRATSYGRVTYMTLLYGTLSGLELAGAGPAWAYFGLLWIVPLFTTFPLFMILRQWVQHGNADRGRYTNTRVFLAGPFIRYAVFPWGMDYHLPHHLVASVPHYNLKALHALLMSDPQYREKGVVVEGYFGKSDPRTGHPTALAVLGAGHAPSGREAVYIDNAALEHADVSDPEAIRRQAELSERAG